MKDFLFYSNYRMLTSLSFYLGLIYGLAIGVPIAFLILAILIYIKMRGCRNSIYYQANSAVVAPSKLGKCYR